AAVSIPLLSKPWRSIAISYDSLLSVPRMLLNSDTVPRILFISFHWSLLMTRSFCTIGWFSSSPSSPFAITQWISARGKDSRITLRKGRLCTTSPRELGLMMSSFAGAFVSLNRFIRQYHPDRFFKTADYSIGKLRCLLFPRCDQYPPGADCFCSQHISILVPDY